ncbi:hypothetical protein [Xanthocytophaga agilis]|uniref:Uncharacterized protein n=1 Tax=Xanthocytophaga agilis TaxID=3048010 RepID=A0AAE3R065_9BACT|nr:hypothetical protein [Xanthocytophaga agilis]MDJ1501261.1 hypothetical protein [Xanthocytophaga agilis]
MNTTVRMNLKIIEEFDTSLTVINEKQYKRYKIAFFPQKELDYIRQEGSKIYLLDNSYSSTDRKALSKEYLLFDLNAAKGSEWKIYHDDLFRNAVLRIDSLTLSEQDTIYHFTAGRRIQTSHVFVVNSFTFSKKMGFNDFEVFDGYGKIFHCTCRK